MKPRIKNPAGKNFNLKIEPDHVTYYIGRQTIVPNPQGGAMALWRKALLASSIIAFLVMLAQWIK